MHVQPVKLPLLLELDLPEATPSNNELRGMHFRAYLKLRHQWQFMVLGALPEGGLPAEPIKRCFVHIERHSAGAGLDWDNAYGGLKPLLDCLVQGSDRNPDGLGIIFDDSPAYMPYAPWIEQHKAKPGHGRTVVRIFDATDFTLQTPAWMQ